MNKVKLKASFAVIFKLSCCYTKCGDCGICTQFI